MDNLNLLNTLLLIIYRLLELLKAIGAVLFIPFIVLHAFMTMNMREAISFSRIEINHRLNHLKTFGITLKFTVKQQKTGVSVRSYDEEAKDASDQFNSMKHRALRAQIKDALRESHRFCYVVFQTYESGSMFIQIRSDTGIYLLDFPLTKFTLNRDYAIDIIKLFRLNGFVKNQPGTINHDKTYSIEALSDDMTTIQANLGTSDAFVIDLATTIFKRIFKSKRIPEVAFG